MLIAGCSASKDVYYEIPADLKSTEAKAEFISNYKPYIEGKKFFIDPGHGGEDRNNKGFEGTAVEADLNLRVGLALRDYLEEAGAKVQMSRTKDATVNLKDRSIIANASGADMFISIHHNAPGKHGDIRTDYTSTYYHAFKTDYEYEPCDHDIARYIQRDLSYAMRNSGGPGSFDGTYSDYMIYPGMGFSVLRLTKLPSVLVECAFNTQHFEARRLVLEEFNKIEAWGIFRGLCRYFKNGIPQITPEYNADSLYGGSVNFSFLLSDSAGIDPESVKFQFDSVYVNTTSFNPETGKLEVNLADVIPGTHTLRVIAANKNGNHAFPFHQVVEVLKK